MICNQCSAAADRRAPADQHCTDPACMCGHRTDRYRAQPAITVDDRTPPMLISTELLDAADPPINLGRLLAGYEQQAAEMDAHADAVEAAITRIEADHGPDDTIRILRTDTAKEG